MSKILALMALLMLGLTLSACDNTIRGIGADAEETGDAVKDVFQ